MAKSTRRTPKKERLFLESLRETANVREACSLANVPRRTVYGWRDQDDVFASRWFEALEEATEKMEREALRRAIEGVEKPVYQGGALVGHVQEYSDTLLIFLLKAHKPEKYQERKQVNVNQRISGKVTVEHTGVQETLDLLADVDGSGD